MIINYLDGTSKFNFKLHFRDNEYIIYDIGKKGTVE